MCTEGCLSFAQSQLRESVVAGARVLEVGSCDVNGSVRSIVARHAPTSYVGVDIKAGPGVDVVCPAGKLVEQFGARSFEVVISTEMLEHVADWQVAVAEMKAVLRKGGRMILTTRSPGFQLHGYPADFWRFTMDDMRMIFADFNDLLVTSDRPESPGVFVSGTKSDRPPVPLGSLTVYSMVTRSRRRRATVLDRFLSRGLISMKRRVPVGARRLTRRALSGVRPAR